jgi:hypothetical protein
MKVCLQICSAMGNLRPFKLFNAALLKPLKYAFFIEKSTKSVEKACTLALDITVKQKFGPRTDLGCPWLDLLDLMIIGDLNFSARLKSFINHACIKIKLKNINCITLHNSKIIRMDKIKKLYIL